MQSHFLLTTIRAKWHGLIHAWPGGQNANVESTLRFLPPFHLEHLSENGQRGILVNSDSYKGSQWRRSFYFSSLICICPSQPGLLVGAPDTPPWQDGDASLRHWSHWPHHIISYRHDSNHSSIGKRGVGIASLLFWEFRGPMVNHVEGIF